MIENVLLFILGVVHGTILYQFVKHTTVTELLVTTLYTSQEDIELLET
jgi:hypothetical protein